MRSETLTTGRGFREDSIADSVMLDASLVDPPLNGAGRCGGIPSVCRKISKVFAKEEPSA